MRSDRKEGCADERFEEAWRRGVDAEMKVLKKGKKSNSAAKEKAKFFEDG